MLPVVLVVEPVVLVAEPVALVVLVVPMAGPVALAVPACAAVGWAGQ